MSLQNDEPDILQVIGGIGLTVIVIILLIAFFSTCKIIGPGERGVKVTLGKISPTPYEEGMHFITPFISHIQKWNVQTVTSNIKTEVQTKDIQVASISYTLAYHLKPEQVAKLQREVGRDYYSKLIMPVVEGHVKDIIGRQNAAELIANREAVTTQIRSKLQTTLNTTYFEVTDFNITHISYGTAFMRAIEDKVTAEQEALKAKNRTVQVQEEARQKILTAEAEAKAIQLKASALANNKQLVELEYAKKWDGKLPQNMYGGAVPFINVK